VQREAAKAQKMKQIAAKQVSRALLFCVVTCSL
jgi:hypothetical protein